MKCKRRTSFRFVTIATTFCFFSVTFASQLRGQEPESLGLVPADASFYSCATRLREQFDTLMATRAVAKLRQMPIVQMGIATALAEWNNPDGEYAEFKAMYEQPENRQLVELLSDAVSHEVFIYGDKTYSELLKLVQQLNAANQQMMRDTTLLEGPPDGEQMTAQLEKLLVEYLEDAKVPDTVIGFKLSDTEPAAVQLDRLEQILNALLQDHPELKERLAREKIAGGDFLTMDLDGTLIPWDSIQTEVPMNVMKVREKLTQKKAKVAVGVLGDFLIVSIGDSTDHLQTWGKGDVLADVKELAPLKKHANEKLCSVGYASNELMSHVTSSQQQLDQLVAAADMLLPLSGLEDSVQKEMLDDVEELVERFKKALPTTDAGLNYVFATDRGYEGFGYSWSEGNAFDASKPLTILDHVGGDPILMVAGRGKYSLEHYDTFAKAIERGIYYSESIVVPQLDADERDFFRRVRSDMAKLINQLDSITRNKLLPAFRDGQGALVLDAQVTSKKWYEALPESDEPLPMLELGLVYGVSDAQLLKEGASEYFRVLQEIIDTLHRAEPTTIPEFKIPTPETRKFPEGDVYYYLLPAQLGVDKQIAPNAGLSTDTLVLSAIPKTTVRLLAKTPYQADDVISKHQGPAAAAFRFSLSSLIDVALPWIDYGIEVSGEEVDEANLAQVQTGLEIAKCWRSIAAVTYQEDRAWVTHFEAHFEDLPE